MNQHYQTYVNKDGYRLEINYDDIPSLYGHLAEDTVFNYYTWDDFESIDKNDFRDLEDWFDVYVGDDAFDRLRENSIEAGLSKMEFVGKLMEKLDSIGIYAKPILSYNHGSIVYYLGESIDRWDGSIAGIAFAEKKDIYKEYQVSRLSPQLKEKLDRRIEAHLNGVTNIMNGEVFSFMLYSPEGQMLDSCGGFFGYESDETMLEEIFHHIPDEATEADYKELENAYVEFTDADYNNTGAYKVFYRKAAIARDGSIGYNISDPELFLEEQPFVVKRVYLHFD